MTNEELFARVQSMGWTKSQFARECGVSPQLVNYWRLNGVTARKAGKVALVLGISVHDVRPDLFPKEVA